MSIQLEVRSYRGGDRHHHDFSQILLPMQGAMRLDVEGRRGVVSHSCVALIPRHREHGFEPSSDCSMLILDVDVAGLGGEMPPTLLDSPEPSLLPIAPWLWRMFRQLGTEVETGACPAEAAARMAMTALHLVEPEQRPQPWSRAERRELQRLLIARGYELGEPDGMIGERTREALRAAQRELGLPADGRAGQKALKALKASQAPLASPAPRGAG